ncbi:MAG TPA: S46 family peptidase [Steroidobacteraceae bacterium]
MTANKLTALILVLAAMPVCADEGMWTYHDFPQALVKKQYGADITPAWLDKVRTATVRLSGCTASFVSPEGLILTNHHCAAGCLDENSTSEKNLTRDGFLARRRDQEVRCTTQVADVLMAMENVTDKVAAAIRNLDEKAANDTRKKVLTQLEQACEQASAKAQTGALKCESVNLYQGGQYWLYKYKRYQDLRLVFAPEEAIAAFGGDPDNFQFPRWDLDMSILRAYDSHGKAAATPSYLRIRPEGPKVGEVVFVSGHPGRTSRLLTVAQLEQLRDVVLPQYLLRLSELRGRYIQYGKTSPEAARIAGNPLLYLENSLKVVRKLLDALLDDRLLQHKRDDEAALRAKAALPTDPWAAIASAEKVNRILALPYTYLEGRAGFNSQLFGYARDILRGTAERQKPNTQRLREYRDTALPRLEQELQAPVPIHPELENLTLSFSLERMREWLGPDNETIRLLLAKDSPDTLAARVISGSKLADPQVRMQLWNGGSEAVAASHDPMIELARLVDPTARAVRKHYEDEVEAPIDAASEQIAQARFRVYGTSVPPDATFTLRLNFGTVQGWKEGDHDVEPFTYLSRFFARATGQEPFKVPDTWLAAKGQLDMETKFDLSTNNDIVGGNSGSPLLDGSGRLVGLMFDGNIHSIAGSYWFDPELNRSVAVHPAIILAGLRKVYKANELLAELGVK